MYREAVAASKAPNLVEALPVNVFTEPVNVNTLEENVFSEAVDAFSDAVVAFNAVILAADEVMLETSILLTVNEPVNMGLCITIVVFYINIL